MKVLIDPAQQGVLLLFGVFGVFEFLGFFFSFGFGLGLLVGFDLSVLSISGFYLSSCVSLSLGIFVSFDFRLSLLLSPKKLSDFPIPLGVSEVRPCLAFKAGSFFQLTFVHVDNNRVRLSTCLQGFPWNRDQSVTSPK